MKAVIQRVQQASVSIDGKLHSCINQGLLLLVGFESSDTQAILEWVAAKILGLRIFSDAEGKMNRSLRDVEGELLVVSQFTLYGDTRRGNRPSFVRAAPAALSEPLYNAFVATLSRLFGKPVSTGVFGADMQVALVNDGPVTIEMEWPE